MAVASGRDAGRQDRLAAGVHAGVARQGRVRPDAQRRQVRRGRDGPGPPRLLPAPDRSWPQGSDGRRIAGRGGPAGRTGQRSRPGGEVWPIGRLANAIVRRPDVGADSVTWRLTYRSRHCYCASVGCEQVCTVPKFASGRHASAGGRSNSDKSDRATSLFQLCEFIAAEGRIDDDKRTVHDVAVLGSKSRNGYTYEQSALTSAAKVFEGARVFVNHHIPGTGDKSRGRDVREYVGRLNGLRVDGGTVRAESFIVANEAHWPLVKSIARDPKAFGFSIDGTGRRVGDKVVEVMNGRSVDLVADPATVSGLFEQADGSEVQTVIFNKRDWNAQRARAWLQSHDMRSDKMDETSESLRFRQREPGEFKRMRTSNNDNAGRNLPRGITFVFGFHESTGEHDMDMSEAKLDDLKKERGDLSDEITSLKDQLAKLQEESKTRDRELAIERELRDNKVGDIPVTFREALSALDDPKKRLALLKEWGQRPAQPRSTIRENGGADLKEAELDGAWTGSDAE